MSNDVYKIRPGARVGKIDIQKAGEKLQQLRDKGDGFDTETILDEAKKKRSPLHGHFEWDDRIAGHEFRLIQARQLVRAIIRVCDDGSTEPVFVHIKSEDINYYQDARIAAQNVDEWTIVHQTALRVLQSASDNLERLDGISRRVNHKSAGRVARARKAVDKANREIRESS